MDAREQRGLEIAARMRISRGSTGWIVPSQNGNGKYLVKVEPEVTKCNCPDYELRKLPCKHIFAVQIVIRREGADGSKVTETVTVTRTVEKKPTYKQDWPAYNKAQTEEKGQFQVLLSDLCRGIVEPTAEAEGPATRAAWATMRLRVRLQGLLDRLGATVHGRHAGRPRQGLRLRSRSTTTPSSASSSRPT